MLHEERRGIVRTDRMEDKEGRSCDTARTLACGVIDFDTLKAVVETLMQLQMHVIKGYLVNAAIVWQ